MNKNADLQTFEAAIAAARAKDYARALEIANGLLARNPKDANALQIVGLVRGRQGRHPESLAAFMQADAIAPNQPPILNSIGILLKGRGEHASARSYLERAVQLNPSLLEAHINLASVFAELGERELARQSYEAAIKLNVANADSWGKFARFHEEDHNLTEARTAADRALALNPLNGDAHIALAAIEARDGKHQAVVDRVTPLLQTTPVEPVSSALLCGSLARALDKLGRYDESFAASVRANSILEVHYAERVAQRLSPMSPANLARLIGYFESADISAWTRHADLEGPTPIFLMGFPRSGTTMLDQILSSHSKLFALEEKDTLVEIAVEIVLAENGLQRLRSLSRDEVNRFRAAYWKRVGAHAPTAAQGKLFIDKMPLNTTLLGLIYRIFPDAKIIFALRDPRDVVLSCFQQTFGINIAMYQLLSLDTAARYYDQVMTIGRLCREKLPLRLHEVRYENVVGDLRAEIEPLLAFLGLDWSDAMERYYETARTRVIRTPSAKQVIEKPYQSSIGKWRRYEKQMLPVLPLLAPWAREFGYDPE